MSTTRTRSSVLGKKSQREQIDDKAPFKDALQGWRSMIKMCSALAISGGLFGLSLVWAGCGSGSSVGGSGDSGSSGSPETHGGSSSSSGAAGMGPGASSSSGGGPDNGSSSSSGGSSSGGSSSGGSSSGGSSSAGSSGSSVDAAPPLPPSDGGGVGAGGTCATPLPKPACNGNVAYKNPAMGNIGTHDPSVVKDGCTFYLFQTNHNIVPSATSTDLINWKSINAPSVSPTWWGSGVQIWAPDVHFANGKFWNYYSVWHGAIPTAQIGLATNTTVDPSATGYQWVDQGLVVDVASGGGSGVNVIDPDFFIDDDGSWWLSYGSFNQGVRLIELDPSTGLPKKPMSPTSITDHMGEGSSLIKNNGWYYSFVSRGKCCAGTSSSYEIIYGRSKTIKGPYATKSGANYSASAFVDATDALLRVGSDGNTGGEGGQSFFKENGQWYVDYHTYNPGAQGIADLDVRPIYFDATDWPTFDCTQAAH